MKEGEDNIKGVIGKAGIAIAWIFLGCVLGWNGLEGVKSGMPTRQDVGIWWNYLALIVGAAMVITGICYYFVGRVKAYLDWEAEQLEPGKGKYGWFGLYTLWRFFRK